MIWAHICHGIQIISFEQGRKVCIGAELADGLGAWLWHVVRVLDMENGFTILDEVLCPDTTLTPYYARLFYVSNDDGSGNLRTRTSLTAKSEKGAASGTISAPFLRPNDIPRLCAVSDRNFR